MTAGSLYLRKPRSGTLDLKQRSSQCPFFARCRGNRPVWGSDTGLIHVPLRSLSLGSMCLPRLTGPAFTVSSILMPTGSWGSIPIPGRLAILFRPGMRSSLRGPPLTRTFCSEGRVLDISRTSRLFPPLHPQNHGRPRQGLHLPRLQHTRPLVRGHHIGCWSRGGPTDTTTGRLVNMSSSAVQRWAGNRFRQLGLGIPQSQGSVGTSFEGVPARRF